MVRKYIPESLSSILPDEVVSTHPVGAPSHFFIVCLLLVVSLFLLSFKSEACAKETGVWNAAGVFYQ